MSGQHSFLPPSGASAWKQCAAWPAMNALYPKDDTPESLEGNAAHWVAWELLAGHRPVEGNIDPAGIVITNEMIQGGELLVDTIFNTVPLDSHLNVEKPVAIKRIHDSCYGTPDVWFYDKERFILYVWDYKFGHRFVDEFENDQGVCYVEGIIAELSIKLGIPEGQLDQLITVEFTIIQPRCFHKGAPVRTWKVRADTLRGQVNQLANAATLTFDPVPTATTNTECTDCPGSHACAALQEAAYSDSEYAVTSQPVELTPQAAALELRIMERSLERLQARVEGLRENVAAYIKQGHRVPFWCVEQGYGRDQWNVPNEQVFGIGELYGVDLSQRKPLTPKQAAKLGIDETVIKQYSTTPLGKIKLIPDNESDARRVFGNHT